MQQTNSRLLQSEGEMSTTAPIGSSDKYRTKLKVLCYKEQVKDSGNSLLVE